MTRPSFATLRSVPALLVFFLTLIIGLVLDLWTKRVAFDQLAPWGIEQVDEIGPRQGALQVVPKRSLQPGVVPLLGIYPGPSIDEGGNPTVPGVTIAGVSPTSPAGRAIPIGDTPPREDLERGDRIVEINGQPIANVAQLEAAVSKGVADLNSFFAQPAASVSEERSTPPPPRGIDLRVLKHGDPSRPIVLRIRPDESALVHPFLPDYLHFQALVNQGAVFGIGQGKRWLFLVVSTLAILFILYLFATSGKHRFYQFILGLLLAGVIGNMYDRLHLGFVRDMIHGLPGRKWPGSDREIFPWIFNLADSWLCVGVGLIFLYTLRGAPGTRDRKEGVKEGPAAAATKAG